MRLASSHHMSEGRMLAEVRVVVQVQVERRSLTTPRVESDCGFNLFNCFIYIPFKLLVSNRLNTPYTEQLNQASLPPIQQVRTNPPPARRQSPLPCRGSKRPLRRSREFRRRESHSGTLGRRQLRTVCLSFASRYKRPLLTIYARCIKKI